MTETEEPEFCPHCGSDDIVAKYDNRETRAGGFDQWYWVDCNGCGKSSEVH